MSTVVSSTHVDVLLQVAVVLRGFAPTSHISTFNGGVRLPMSEQIYTSVPNQPSLSKDNRGFDEVVFKSGGNSDLYLEYLANGSWFYFGGGKITCLIFRGVLIQILLMKEHTLNPFRKGITKVTLTITKGLRSAANDPHSLNLPRQ